MCDFTLKIVWHTSTRREAYVYSNLSFNDWLLLLERQRAQNKKRRKKIYIQNTDRIVKWISFSVVKWLTSKSNVISNKIKCFRAKCLVFLLVHVKSTNRKQNLLPSKNRITQKLCHFECIELGYHKFQLNLIWMPLNTMHRLNVLTKFKSTHLRW